MSKKSFWSDVFGGEDLTPKKKPAVKPAATGSKPEGCTEEQWKEFLTQCETGRKAQETMEAKRKAQAEIAAKKKAEEEAKKRAEAEAAASRKAKFASAESSLRDLVAYADSNPEFAKYFVEICKKIVDRSGKDYAYFFEDEEGKLIRIEENSKSFPELQRLGLTLLYEVDKNGKPIGDPIEE